MSKSFDELTIADDFMFCKIMQDEEVCQTFLEMTLADKIGKISYLSSQNAITIGSEAKSIRLDILVKNEAGKTYDIEMCFPIYVRVYRKTSSFAFRKTSLLLTPCHPWQVRNNPF